MNWKFWQREHVNNRKKSKQKDLEKTAKALQTVIDTGYLTQRRVYRVNFFRGVFFGLGSALGATVILTILIWVLSLFGELPIIGGFVDTIENSVQDN